MKTLKKAMCIVLCVIMAFSCVSFAASAEGETVNSSVKYYTQKSDTYNAGVTLDALDEIFAQINVYEEIKIIEGVTVAIDLRDVNGFCKTIDLFKQILEVDGVHDLATTALIKKALGDFGNDVNFKNWTTGMSRTKNDVAILKGLLRLVSDNRKVISGVIKMKNEAGAKYSLGIFDEAINLEEMFGPDGVSSLFKQILFSTVYDTESPEFEAVYNTYKDDIDAFIYGELVAKLANDYLPGFTMDESSTVEELICVVFGLFVDKYIVDAVKGIEVDLAASDVPALRALDGIVNLKGSTYDFSNITLDPDKPLLGQINGLFGAIVAQMVPSFTGWTSGGYEKIDDNYEKLLKYIGKTSGLVPDADSLNLEELALKVANLTLLNADFGVYTEGVEECESLEEIATVMIKNLVNEWSIGVQYKDSDSYLVVLGDMLARLLYDGFDIKDLSGKSYVAGGGKDVFEVMNYFANYLLFDKGAAGVLGLSVSKNDSIFKKIDKILDYFGETKAKGVNFNSEEFFLGSGSKKGLIESCFTLDIENILELTLVPALENAGDVSAIEFMYKTVQYFANNWAGKTLFPVYQKKAFTNAMSNDSIANMVSVFVETLNSRVDAFTVWSTFVFALLSQGEPEVYEVKSAKINSCEATGGKLYPEAEVVIGNKKLEAGKDYVVQTNAKTPGPATATISFIGMYDGEIERSFDILLGSVKDVACMSTTSSVKIAWDKVPFADGYNIYLYKNGSYKAINDELVTENQFLISGLSAATEYDIRIDTVSEAFGTRTGETIDVATTPDAVKESTIKTTTNASKAKLDWTAVSSASHYKIEKYAGSNKWQEVTITDKTTYTVDGLDGYTTYNFRITALKKLSNGSYIAAAPASVKAKTTLGAVEKVSAAYTSNSITVSWTPVTNAQAYQILQYVNNKWVQVAAPGASATSYKVTGLKTATKYRYAVRAAVKENGKWIFGGYKEITQYTGLAMPKTFKVSATNATAAKITWSAVANAKGYQVFQYIGGKWVSKGTTKSTSATISGLPSGTTTYFKVRAYTTVNGAYLFGDATSHVGALTLPGKVNNVKLVVRSTNSISFKWDKVTGAAGYQIFRYHNGKWVSLGTTTALQYTDSKSMTKGVEYQYRVRAVQKVGSTYKYGDASSTFKAKTTLVGSSKI